MISRNLFQRVLVNPVTQNQATKLFIVSGYASGSMAYRHLATPEIVNNNVEVNLVVGMASEGVGLADHSMFTRLEAEERFRCYYRITSPTVHSKVYVWMAGNEPVKALVGSANYSEQGLRSRQQENVMTDTDPDSALSYFEETLQGTMEVSHDDIEQHVRFYRGDDTHQSRVDNDCITVSLLMRNGQVHNRAGLNWGQRPEYERNPNQAYIQLGARIARSGFFPPKPERFTVITDDGLSLIAVRASKDTDGRGGDSLETPEGNHILGAYFRARLSVPSGNPVTRQHLEAYGRTDVEFCRLDEDTFLMNFSL